MAGDLKADLETAEGAKDFVDGLGDVLREIWYNKGTLPSIAYVLARYLPAMDGGVGEPMPHVVPVPLCVLLPDGRELTKDEFSHLIHMLAEKSHAVGVVFASECWMVLAKPGEKVPHGDLEHVPGRTEGIFISLEHRKLRSPYGVFAEITRKSEDDRGMLGTFTTMYEFLKAEPGAKGEMTRTEGRFTNFLKPQT